MKRWFVFLLLLFPVRLFAQAPCTTGYEHVTPTPAAITTALGTIGDNFVMCLDPTTGMGGSGGVPANMSNFNSPVSPVSTTGVLDVNATIAGEIRGAGPFNSTCVKVDGVTPVEAFGGGCGSAQQTKLYMNNSTAVFWWHTTTSTHAIAITNIYFYSDINSTLPTYGFVLPGSTNAAPFVQHHNDYVIHLTNQSFVTNTATNRGRYYRNRIISDYDGSNFHAGQFINHSDGGAGAATWSYNSTFGSADDGTNNLYIEQNYITGFVCLNDLHDGGAREVLRFNDIHSSGTCNHGFDSTPSSGGRGIEIYRNVFSCDILSAPLNAGLYFTQRTGTGFVFDNTFNAYSSNCSQTPLTTPVGEVNQDAAEECNTNGGWPGQPPAVDGTHNSHPIPHQVGWGFDSHSATNPAIGTSPSSGTAIHQTNMPGATSSTNLWPYPTDGVQQSLEPLYAMHNTNHVVTNSQLIAVKDGPTNCRAIAWSSQTKANSQTLQIPIDVRNEQPFNSIPYANVGMQAVMVLADNIGSGTITPTITVAGSPSCGTITALTAGTSGSMRLSAWTCTITADGPQTVLFTSSASASTAARAGSVMFIRGLLSGSLPFDKNPAVAANAAGPVGGINVSGASTGSGTQTAISQDSTSGTGSGATFTVQERAAIYFVTVVNPGSGYHAGDTITILGGHVGGTNGTNDLTMTVSSYSATPGSNYASANTFIIGYFALPVSASSDNLQPGLSDSLPQECNFECATYTGAGLGFGRYVGTNGTAGGSDVSVATTYRIVNSTTAVGVQESDSDNTGATVLAGSVAFTVKSSTANFATVKTALDMNSTDFIRPDIEIYGDIPSTGGTFDGTSGTGAGLRMDRPATCTTGVAYWSTDQGSWNTPGSGGNGVLDKCTDGMNANPALRWTDAWYVPYVFPYPGEVDGAPTQSFSSQPTNTVTGVAFSAITVTVNPPAADSITLSDTSGTCTFTGTATQTSDSMTGIATFNLTAGNVGTSCALTAHNNTDGTIADVMSATFNVTSSCVPDHLTFTGQPSDALVGGSLGTVHVAVKDAGGNTCTSDTSTVTLSAHAGSTAASPTSSSNLSKAAVAGVATWTDLSVTPTPGSISLDANDGMLTLGTSSTINISSPVSNPGNRGAIIFRHP